MKISITERLDFTLRQIEILRHGLNSIAYNKELLLSDILGNSTDYFNRENDHRHYQDCESLDSEIRNWFLNQQDSKLQDRFANYLIELLINKFRRLDIDLSILYDAVKDGYYCGVQETKQGKVRDANGSFCGTLDDLVMRWIYILRKNVKTFAPELHKEHSYTLDRLLPIYDEEGDEIEHPNGQPQPTEPDAKNSKETPTKDQILPLHKLGVFDIPAVKNLTMENKGKLFAWLLNRNEKNVTECIRNCDPDGNKRAEDNPYIYENKVAAVDQLLKDVGYFTKL